MSILFLSGRVAMKHVKLPLSTLPPIPSGLIQSGYGALVDTERSSGDFQRLASISV
jgi:hypothetical protein